MPNLKGKKILIFQQRGWGRRIGRFLAAKLYAEGCKLAALTFKNTTHELIVKQDDAKYEMIISNDKIMSRPKDYLGGDRYSLKEICDKIGVDSIWPIVSTLRNHVRSYKDKYYYSFKQNVSDEEIIDYIMAVYKYMNIFFHEFKPDVIITPNFVSFPHVMFNLYARKLNIPIFAITDSKISGYYIFTYDYNDSDGPFYRRADELNSGKVETENRKKAKEYIREFRENFKKPDYMGDNESEPSMLQKIKKELSPYAQIIRWYLKKQINVLESTGITIDYKPPRIILRDHYCHERYKKFMEHYSYYPFSKVKKFVYFPLQFQPEATIDVISPRFNNQIETARQVAMSLPGDYTLVVKEHPGMVGLRPPSYIKKIDRTPNIKLIDYKITSEEVLKKTDLIISPSGTTIAEAAFFKKPVIQLGNLGTTLKLPNVFKYTDMTSLPKKIKEVLEVNLNTNDYERRLENYVAAVFDVTFNFNYIKAWEKGTGDLEKLWVFYRKEIENSLIN
ncbi:hypothetical protein COX67_02215 [Candidatus Falkowbacteria bacterium CG_4_10_14_0_2_um_filter_36_22]|nr:MAG: hypothetical protein COX67_02215 [Candidatus Falkowbacteria bacterium CG_4_10_14_0_2_um_filter_36_22]